MGSCYSVTVQWKNMVAGFVHRTFITIIGCNYIFVGFNVYLLCDVFFSLGGDKCTSFTHTYIHQ